MLFREPTHFPDKAHPLLNQAVQTLMERLHWFKDPFKSALVTGPYGSLMPKFAADMTYCSTLPNQESNLYQCVISFFALQIINDIPGYLKHIHRMLQPGGFFCAVFIGGESFLNLKNTLMLKEEALTNKFSLRVHPSIHIADAVHLMSGFSCPLADSDTYPLFYDNIYTFIKELRSLKSTSYLKDQTFMSKNLARQILEDQTPFEDQVSFIYLTGLKQNSSNRLNKFTEQHSIMQ